MDGPLTHQLHSYDTPGERLTLAHKVGSHWGMYIAALIVKVKDGNVTSIGVLGFPKTEIEGKPQINFQTDFIKLMFKHKGGSTEERKVP